MTIFRTTFALVAAQAVSLTASAAIPAITPLYGLAHATLGATAIALLRRRDEAIGGSLLSWICAAAGPVGILIGLLAKRRPWRRSLPALFRSSDLRQQSSASAVSSLDRLLDARLVHAPRSSFVSFASIFRHGSVEDRTAALITATRSFEPRLAPVIAQALCDPDATVRAQAASASSEILARFHDAREAMRFRAEGGVAMQTQGALLRFLADHARYNVLLSTAQRAACAAEGREVATAALARLDRNSPRWTETQAILRALEGQGSSNEIRQSQAAAPSLHNDQDGVPHWSEHRDVAA